MYLFWQLLSEAAKECPNQLAVIYKNERKTYSEVEKVTNQLANLLLEHGVKKGDRIGLWLPKSPESFVSMFGILKAGAICVPLNVAAPPLRISSVIKSCGVRGLIATSKKFYELAKAVDVESNISLALLKDSGLESDVQFPSAIETLNWEQISSAKDSYPPLMNISIDPAFIFHTSGATGEPKGILNTHLQLLNIIDPSAEIFEIRKEDKVCAYGPQHLWAPALYDLILSLKAKATTVIGPMNILPRSIAEYIERQKITVLISAPTLLMMLMFYGDLKTFKLPNLRMIAFGAGVFPMIHFKKLVEMLPHVEYYQVYAASEIGGPATCYRISKRLLNGMERIPVGKPFPNFEVFLINEKGELANPGEVGEAYVRSATIMKGYWNMPKETEEALVQNMFQRQFEDKLYRTKDLLKMDAEGNYIFIARIDNVIKSRGYLINLEEIEYHLRSHPKIKDAGAIGIPHAQFQNKIKAFVVLAENQSLSENDVKKVMAQRLPSYAVPELVEFRAALPKTALGKIDRRRLEEGQ